jgi:hypothetical protein
MLGVEFETTALMFDRVKTVHVLDSTATVIGICVKITVNSEINSPIVAYFCFLELGSDSIIIQIYHQHNKCNFNLTEALGIRAPSEVPTLLILTICSCLAALHYIELMALLDCQLYSIKYSYCVQHVASDSGIAKNHLFAHHSEKANNKP